MIEYLDIVDENNVVVGTAPREEVYKNELMHRIVHVLIFNAAGDMALQLRSKNVSYCPGHWSTAVGGHVQSGETYHEAAMREYREELGVSSNLEELGENFYVNRVESPDKFLFTFTSMFEGPFNIDKEDVEDIQFFSIDTIKEMIKNGELFHPELLFLFEKYYS